MQRLVRLAASLLVAVSLPSSATAIGISLNQIGGTATGGVGQIGDTVVVGIDVVLAPGDVLTAVGVALEWDLEGGDVLDITMADEEPVVLVGATTPLALSPINGVYRHGSAVDDTVLIPSGTEFPATFAGPTFTWGWEQVTLIADGADGPDSFRIGTATFVLRDVGTTTVDFATGILDFNTFVFGQGFIDETGEVIFDEIDITSVGLAGLTLQVIPEPRTGALLALGLLALAGSRRRG